MEDGVSYDFVFTELPLKTVSGDVTAFHRITIVVLMLNMLNAHDNLHAFPQIN